MKIEYHHHYSGYLGREMEFKVYGHGGKPVIFIPCQGGNRADMAGKIRLAYLDLVPRFMVILPSSS